VIVITNGDELGKHRLRSDDDVSARCDQAQSTNEDVITNLKRRTRTSNQGRPCRDLDPSTEFDAAARFDATCNARSEPGSRSHADAAPRCLPMRARSG
jgi:hypothetical protein